MATFGYPIFLWWIAAPSAGVLNTKTITDTATLADVRRKLQEARSLDAVVTFEVLRQFRRHTAADLGKLTDGPRLARFLRLDDAASVRESLRELRRVLLLDSARITEGPQTSYEWWLADIMPLSDSAVAEQLRAILSAIVTDVLSLGDATRMSQYLRKDALVPLTGTARLLREHSLADLLTLADTNIADLLRAVTLLLVTDVLALQDETRTLREHGITDVARVTEGLRSLREHRLADQAVLLDTVTTELLRAITTVLVTDTLRLADDLRILREHRLTDALGLSETPRLLRAQRIADAASLLDVLRLSTERMRLVTELLALADSIGRRYEWTVVAADVAALADALRLLRRHVLGDNLALADSAIASLISGAAAVARSLSKVLLGFEPHSGIHVSTAASPVLTVGHNVYRGIHVDAGEWNE